MYTVATYRLVAVTGAGYLMFIPRVFVFFALAAWTLTFIGLIGSLVPRRSALST